MGDINGLDINTIPIALCLTKRLENKDIVIQFANKKFYELFGYTSPELEGQKVNSLVPLESRHIHEEHAQKYFDEEAPKPLGLERTFTGLKKDNSTIRLEITLYPLDDSVLVIAEDVLVKEARKAIAEVRATIDKLRASAEHIAIPKPK